MERFYQIRLGSLLLLLALTTASAFAQRSVSGTVRDEAGEPLIGVNVVIMGLAGVGTATDINGFYELQVPAGSDALQFSYTGYQVQEVSIGTRTVIDVIMAPAASLLQEIVVTGYGTQRAEAVTGSVSRVDMEELSSIPLTSVEQAMQGRVAGVQVVQTGGGTPGGAMQVNIRGIGTINGETPLYVIDGIPVQEGGQNDRGYSFLNNLNPNDIESIDILKDASAAAIYGSRASGGVVLITTKRGSAGPTKVSFDAYYGMQFRGKTYDVLDADGYANYLRELHSQPDGQIPTAFANGAVPRNVDTDWQKELFQSTAPIQNYNLGLSGGQENARFSIGLEYFNQEGIMIGSDFERYSVRANSDFKIGKRIKIGETLLLSKTRRNSIQNSGGRRAQEHAIKQSPFVSVYDDSFKGGFGHPDTDEGQDARNPIADQFLFDDTQDRYRVWGSLYGELEILKGLTYKLQLGLDFAYQDNLSYNPEFQQVRRLTTISAINKSRNQSFNPLVEQFLTYARTFGDHEFSIMAGFSAQSFQFTNVGGSGQALPENVISLNAATTNLQAFDALVETSLRSLFGRLTYSFRDKYLLTANIRRDESSKLFRGNNPTGIFPSVSVGWRVSNEPFLEDNPVISNLKIRAGYGEVGNQTPLSAYPTDVNLLTNFFYVFGNNAIAGISQNNLANPNITWETSRQLDIGFDAGLWNNHVRINFDWYKRNTLDLIWPQQVPASVGLGPAFVNAGEIQNTGIELALTYSKFEGDFTFDIGGNITTINNEVLSLVNEDLIIRTGSPTDDLSNVSWTQVGGSIGTFYGYVNDGIFRNWDEVYNHAYINQATTGGVDDNGVPIFDGNRRDAATATSHTAPGDVKWRDVNGDGIVNTDDQVALGSPIPKLLYGVTFNAGYKGFDFQLFLQGASGNKIFNGAYRWLSDNRQNFNVGAAANNSTAYQENYSASEPRLVRADPNRNILRPSDRYVFNGSFARLKNMTLGYTFGQGVRRGMRASNFRIYVTAQNLLTFTNYFGLEPEVGSYESGTGLDAGIDRLIYPQPRSFIFGLQLGF